MVPSEESHAKDKSISFQHERSHCAGQTISEANHLFFGTSISFPRQDSLEDGLSRRTVIARTSSTGIHFEGIGVEKTSGGRI